MNIELVTALTGLTAEQIERGEETQYHRVVKVIKNKRNQWEEV